MNTTPLCQKLMVYGSNEDEAAFAVEAFNILGGHQAWILEGGISAWEKAGMNVTTNPFARVRGGTWTNC